MAAVENNEKAGTKLIFFIIKESLKMSFL